MTKHFCDFANEPEALEGKKVRLDDVVNREIKILGYSVKPSKYGHNKSGKYLTLQFEFTESEETHVLFTGSDVLVGQMERYGEELPFISTIKKVNRYYTLS